MTRVALGVPHADERRLIDSARRWGHEVVAACPDGDELAERLSIDRPDVVLVAADPIHLVPRLVSACDDAGIRMIVVAASADGVRYAGTLGVIDVREAAIGWEALDPALAPSVDHPLRNHHPSTEPVSAGSDQRGRIIVVWGPAGAPGRTTLAISIAAELAAGGRRVALADADTHAAAVAPTLGLLDEAPGFAAACRLAGGPGLDGEEFDRIARIHPASTGRFPVLTGLGRPSRWPELSSERVTGALRAARDWAEITVVDIASSLDEDEEISSDLAVPRRNAAGLAALREADQVVAVASADPVGLSRFLRAYIDLLDCVPPDRVTVVANRVRASAIGFDPAVQVAQTLRRLGAIDSAVPIPDDRGAVDGAVLSGRTLAEAAPRSPARVAVRDLLVPRLVPADTAGLGDDGTRGADGRARGHRMRRTRASRALRRRSRAT